MEHMVLVNGQERSNFMVLSFWEGRMYGLQRKLPAQGGIDRVMSWLVLLRLVLASELEWPRCGLAREQITEPHQAMYVITVVGRWGSAPGS